MTTPQSIDYAEEAENAIAQMAKIRMGLKCKIPGIWAWRGPKAMAYDWSIYEGHILCSLIVKEDGAVWFKSKTLDFRDDLCPTAKTVQQGRISAGPIMYDRGEMLERLLKRTVKRYEQKIDSLGYTRPSTPWRGFGINGSISICDDTDTTWLGRTGTRY